MIFEDFQRISQRFKCSRVHNGFIEYVSFDSRYFVPHALDFDDFYPKW